MQPQDPQSTPTREQQILRYVQALDEGDADTLATLLAAAETDPELDRLVSEANQEVYEAAGLGPLAADAERVRELLRQHLPSGFPEAAQGPVTVGEVAARLVAARQVPEPDRAAVDSLLGSSQRVPPQLDRETVRALAGQTMPILSERFWRRFRESAVTARIGRAHEEAQVAAARHARAASRRGRPALLRVEKSRPASAQPRDVAAEVRRVFADAGQPEAVSRPGIVPLDELVASYPLRLGEVPGLDWQRAAEFLSRETGRSIAVPGDDRRQLSGFLYCASHEGTLYGVILVDQRDPVVRRRFSAAHELGHYVLHFRPLMDTEPGEAEPGLALSEGLAYGGGEDSLPTGQLTLDGHRIPELGEGAEEEANRFAAALLMPEPAVRAAASSHEVGLGHELVVRRLAVMFLVSREAMRRRLNDLGLGGGKA